ncbi:MAG: metalloregulator ArsR/SmtB family transcription factor [Gemmatimonadales bacterium]|nr:MAG: metalloregulator ArsR/SmtB family transcription factor [Gemmatimonadales bacterium]
MNTNTAPPILDHLSALGDETRTRILVLLERSEFTVSEICLALQLPQPTVSRHLRTLLEDGWLDARTEGRNRHYRFADGLEDELRSLWSVVRAGLESFQVYRRDGERARQVLAERKRQASAFFAASADRWDELRRELFGPRAEYLPLLGFLDPRWVVGDLGAGTGGLAATIAPFVGKVIGIDRSEAMLATARELLAGTKNVELRPGELESLPLEDRELDLAVLSLVLHYVVDPGEALAEAHRVLKPGGRLVVVEMRAHDRGPRYAREMGHVWPGFQPDELTGWLRAAGFEQVVTRPLPPDPEALGPSLFLSAALRP